MRVELGRKGDYAVRATLSVARSYGLGRRKAREIAAEMDIPARYLPQILAELVRGGLLQATAGPDGGYTLARPPAEVSLVDVVEVAEGPLRTDVCILRGGPCDWESVCPLHVTWSDAEHVFRSRLQATSFADLVAIDASIEANRYSGDQSEPHQPRSPRRGVRDGSTSADPPATSTSLGRQARSRKGSSS